MRNYRGLSSSGNIEWETPDYLFKYFDKIYNFTLDPCCAPENAKCEKFFTKEDSGLFKSWQGHRVFMNPPYGRQIPKWIEKAYNEVYHPACYLQTTVTCLIPARTDTRYWHDYCAKADKIIFIKGRIRFGKNKDFRYPTTFPAAVVIFDKNIKDEEKVSFLDIRSVNRQRKFF